MNFGFRKLGLKDAYLISHFYISDNRGSFTKTFEQGIYCKSGIEFHCDETFFSCSAKNVIRGLHFQTHIPQSKLVSVVAGRIWDVVVDLRSGSSTFGQWEAYELSVDNHLSIYVPRGFAHGFASLEDGTIVAYQCMGKYHQSTDTGIIFNDPDIGIVWPIDERLMIHSKRDLEFQSFKEYARNPMVIDS